MWTLIPQEAAAYSGILIHAIWLEEEGEIQFQAEKVPSYFSSFLFTCGEAEQVLQSPDSLAKYFTVALNLLLFLTTTIMISLISSNNKSSRQNILWSLLIFFFF